MWPNHSRNQLKPIQINFGCYGTFHDSIHDEEPCPSSPKKEGVQDLLSAFDAAGIVSQESGAASSKDEPESSPVKSKSESGGHHTKIKFCCSSISFPWSLSFRGLIIMSFLNCLASLSNWLLFVGIQFCNTILIEY